MWIEEQKQSSEFGTIIQTYFLQTKINFYHLLLLMFFDFFLLDMYYIFRRPLFMFDLKSQVKVSICIILNYFYLYFVDFPI